MHLHHFLLAHLPLAHGKGPWAASAPLGALRGRCHFTPSSPHTAGLPQLCPPRAQPHSSPSPEGSPIPTVPISCSPRSACPSFASLTSPLRQLHLPNPAMPPQPGKSPNPVRGVGEAGQTGQEAEGTPQELPLSGH